MEGVEGVFGWRESPHCLLGRDLVSWLFPAAHFCEAPDPGGLRGTEDPQGRRGFGLTVFFSLKTRFLNILNYDSLLSKTKCTYMYMCV